jgi:hypothetical protein
MYKLVECQSLEKENDFPECIGMLKKCLYPCSFLLSCYDIADLKILEEEVIKNGN